MPPSPSPQVRRISHKPDKAKSPTKTASDKSDEKPKGLDLGKTIGLYDTATVREKVRKWQTTGGGIVPVEDALAADSDKESKAASQESAKRTAGSEPKIEIVDPPRTEIPVPPATPTKSPSPEKEPAASATKPRIVERKPAQNRLDAEVRQASAPKKRVVSDGHWRVKRSPPKPAPKPPKPEKEKEKDLQYAWVRAPILPRKPEQEPPPPKPKPQPKPIKIYTARPRTKSFNNAHSIESYEEHSISEDELPRIRTPGTPRQKPFRPKADKSPRAYKSDEDTSPKRARPSRRRKPSFGRGSLEDPFSSPDEQRRSRDSRAKGSGDSPGEAYSRRMGSHRRSLSTKDSAPRRRRTLQKSPKLDISDDEAAKRRKSRREKREREYTELSDEQNSPPFRRLSNHDEEAARRRSTFRDEYARYTPRETCSSERKSTRRKRSYVMEPVDTIERNTDPLINSTDVETPPKPISSRVEAWLTSTPEPLKVPGDGRGSKRAFSFEPLGRNMDEFTESTVDTESTVTDPRGKYKSSSRRGNEHRKSSNTAPRTADRSVRAQSEPPERLDPQIEVEYSSTTSVPTLRRAGARRGSQSPTKERIVSPTPKQSVVESDLTSSVVSSSIVSSSVDPSTFDPPDLRNDFGGLAAKRLFPSTGKRLSTIASVETFNTKVQQAPPSCISEGTEGTAQAPEPPEDKVMAAIPEATPSVVSTTRSRTSLKRKLTTHADLISVLSMPASRSKSIVSARSIRTHRSRLETATIDDLMKELSSDETKYMRELRTLADGVIPVLLKCVLSKSEAAVAAGLFNRFPNSEKDAIADASKAIHDMSVAIQRLKSLHTRIPKDNHFSFLIWAQSAHSVYEKYVKTWRLGFQDVVVSLATEDGSTVSTPKSAADGGAWDQGLPRNDDGYIVDGDGERVDVAFLLKRPLVRLKYLTKTLKGINIKKPSDQSGVLSEKFQGLMNLAKNRVNEEKARLEDEAAATIDATRARDPKSLAPLAGIKIDLARCVRARDYFDLSLPHSSGQQVDCRVELLIRDDAPGRGSSGDVLICEIDGTGRWLFFPPIQFNRISARAGDEPGEIVVMITGVHSGGKSWQELLTLRTQDEEVRFEWIQMLGLSPVPPSLATLGRNRSFKITVPIAESSHGSSLLSATSATASTVPLKSRTPSPRQIEIPIGERADTKSKNWDYEDREPREFNYSDISSDSSVTNSDRATLHQKPKSPDRSSHTSWSSYTQSWFSRNDAKPAPVTPTSVERKTSGSQVSTPTSLNEAMELAGNGSPTLRRTRAKRYKGSLSSPATPVTSSPTHDPRKNGLKSPNRSPTVDHSTPTHASKQLPKSPKAKGYSVWMPGDGPEPDDASDDDEDDHVSNLAGLPGRPQLHRRASSVPSINLPTVTKRSQPSEPETPQASSRADVRGVSLPVASPKDAPSSAPPKVEKRRSEPIKSPSADTDPDKPPPPPPHRTPSSNHVKFAPTPQFTPNSQLKRRSSSPLKHEYQPSSASSSSELSDDSATDYSDDSLASASEDELNDESDIVSSLVPPSLEPRKKTAATETLYSMPNATLTPSQSASQAPYRTVPKQSEKAAKTISTIFCWSDRGQWELLHPEECNILISPGLIEAYEIRPGQPAEGPPKERPLVALELTPLVPLRRGTALDITIRSPPVPTSRLKPGSNIMFRSRSTEECEALYALINTSRINNPTYIALQSARPPTGENTWSAAMDRRNSLRTNGASGGANSWWQFGGSSRSKSYRASTRAPSTAGNTESSVATISSVMAAMKRFSGSGRILDAAKSRMSQSRGGSSGSMGSGGSGAHSPPAFVDPSKPGTAATVPVGLGITNAKIRLYVRQSNGSKWADLGSARLSIMQREMNQDVNTPIMLQTGAEKRIMVVSKAKADVMLDVTLGESCFERVARTGIAVSVWEDVVPEGHGVAATGGVAEKRVKIYMIQLKSERECAYTFSLLGKLRY